MTGNRIIHAGNPIPNAPPANPITIGVDPNTGAVIMQHKDFGQGIIFGSDGTFILQDTYGNIIRTTTDGYVEIAGRIGMRMIGAHPPEVIISETKKNELDQLIYLANKEVEEAKAADAVVAPEEPAT